ncbi:MAG: FtsX-like permease family protein [Lysobacteraceae bacterium]
MHPILSALFRHKTAAALIVLEIALACAIVSNAVFVIGSRAQYMQRDSGLAESELVFISVSSVQPVGDAESHALRREDVAALAAVPGVRSASSINQIPYGGSVWSTSISLDGEQSAANPSASQYMDDGHLLETFGLRLVEGRGFLPEEYRDHSAMEGGGSASAIILTRTLAQRLFPGEKAVGKQVYVYDESPAPVVGVVERLLAPGRGGEFTDDHDSLILPLGVSWGSYAVRVEPGRGAEVLEAAVAALKTVNGQRLIGRQETLESMRAQFYSRDRAVIWLLLVVCVALLAVTALGIVGLASFWVQQRTKQIGVRRALGATRGQILRHFQLENFILTTAGIVLGMGLAYAVNQMLMSSYELPRLPLHYLPIGAALLWLLGQLAVLGPARRAANVPPAIATRSA